MKTKVKTKKKWTCKHKKNNWKWKKVEVSWSSYNTAGINISSRWNLSSATTLSCSGVGGACSATIPDIEILYTLEILVFRCDSISYQLPMSVIDSFRFGDEYRISEVCELVYFYLGWTSHSRPAFCQAFLCQTPRLSGRARHPSWFEQKYFNRFIAEIKAPSEYFLTKAIPKLCLSLTTVPLRLTTAILTTSVIFWNWQQSRQNCIK